MSPGTDERLAYFRHMPSVTSQGPLQHGWRSQSALAGTVRALGWQGDGAGDYSCVNNGMTLFQ